MIILSGLLNSEKGKAWVDEVALVVELEELDVRDVVVEVEVVEVDVEGEEELVDEEELDEMAGKDEFVLLPWAVVPIARYIPIAATTMMITANTPATAFPMARRLRLEQSEIFTVKSPYSKLASKQPDLEIGYLRCRRAPRVLNRS